MDLFNITVPPLISPFAFDEKNFAGETVQLTCFIPKGDLPLKVTWNFLGKELPSNMGMSTTRIGSRTSLLIIESLMADHTGDYTCKVENAAGIVEYSADLFVSG